MMAECTKAAILALLAVDAGATDAEKERVTIALTGARSKGAIVRIADAAKMLRVHRNTIYGYIKAGRLEPVAGNGSKTVGVTEASLAKL